ncbi:MAG: UDP-N-acetylglucosamine 2-epimerase (non-hydrolyzing) [Pirellulaceae bacterium]|nr:UDP-N-acetylglucosamine 2-epimerase (non-hydrolyzing) [Pirellulaceae bacterium]
MSISLIAGARPNFMKIAPLVPAFRAVGLTPRLIHTGQHYDRRMSDTFFEELEIPEPDVNLGVGSGSHVWQISEVMRRLESDFIEHRPAAVVVVGDVNSTLAAAIAANKLRIPVAHVEAGLRSFDRAMPEENNRIMTDAISDWLFISEPSGRENLAREGVAESRIHLVGNVMIDTLLRHLERARGQRAWLQFGLEPRQYVVLTLHRPSNVDDPRRLESILRAVHEVSRQWPVIFPLHPRTKSQIEQHGLAQRSDLNGYQQIEPQGYHAMLGLMEAARFVLTDSGGIQEETTALGVPCLTLRENTERPVTVTHGSNQLVGWRTDDILAAVRRLPEDAPRSSSIPEMWDGRSAERIAEILARGIIE